MAHRRQFLVFISTGLFSATAFGANGLCCRPALRLAENPPEAQEYYICLECETPCYTFEEEAGKLIEALCQACGNDDVEKFVTPAEAQELGSP
ncbi:MAG: hypothetical protein DYH17_15125 [Xanthomonadales bacterium PRO6]|nr:hypothetical protein [Xanthomonadales bacterium]MCE7932692.1 hypothetical protein [Xanthomonadales bacterium PRO6]